MNIQKLAMVLDELAQIQESTDAMASRGHASESNPAFLMARERHTELFSYLIEQLHLEKKR